MPLNTCRQMLVQGAAEGREQKKAFAVGLLVIIKPIMLRKYFSQGAVWVGLDLEVGNRS